MRLIGIEDSLFIHEKEGLYIRIRFSEIMYVVSCSNYCTIHTTKKGSRLVSMTLQEVVSKIPSNMIIKLSRSVVINKEFVEAVRGNEVLVSGKWFILSKLRRKELLER